MRRAPRYAKRVDDNQLQIVRELSQIPGISIKVIGDPVDLLIGYRSKNYLVEIKREDKRHRRSARTPAQVEFFNSWRGQVRIASSTEEILDLLTQSYEHETSTADEHTPASDTEDRSSTRTPS